LTPPCKFGDVLCYILSCYESYHVWGSGHGYVRVQGSGRRSSISQAEGEFLRILDTKLTSNLLAPHHMHTLLLASHIIQSSKISVCTLYDQKPCVYMCSCDL